MLNIIRHGISDGKVPLVIAHGLFGSARNWGVIARRLADTRAVLAVDMRNHGDSPWTDTHGYDEMAHDLAQVITRAGGRADLLGHSMGGKAAMALALTRPELVSRLVVADIAPVAYGHSQRHLIAAMRGLDLSRLTSRTQADARLAPAIADQAVRAFLLQSLDLGHDPPRWRLNLDLLDAEMDRIIGWPGIQGRYGGAALFLAGGSSDYVRPEHRSLIRALFPSARLARMPGAGHWLHAERPRDFEAVLRGFLDANEVRS